MAKLDYAAVSDVGRSRELNEDGFLTADPVFAIADGMGGHQAGEVASDIALKTSLRQLKTDLPAADRLRQAFSLANNRVVSHANRHAGQYGMGTTLTLALFEGGRLWIGHVGDSRAYLFSRGRLSQLTEDHTLVAHLVKEGELDAEAASQHPKRNVITKAVGSVPAAEPDIFSIPVTPGDRLLLCSDGLTAMVADSEIASILENDSPAIVTRELVARANAKGGFDNITVVVVDIGAPKSAANRLWHHRLIIALAALALAFLLYQAAFYSLSRVYFLGRDGEKVAIYQGLPIKIGNYDLYNLKERTEVDVAKLPNYYRDRIKAGIVVGGLAKTKATLKDIASLESGTLP